MKIFVGSTNPVKVNAVTQAASETWPGVMVVGLDVPTGVSEQPRSDEETRAGARNRALAALDDGLQQADQETNEVLGIGLEGGVMEKDGELWSTVWAAVIDTEGTLLESCGAIFKIPDTIADAIMSGGEMGPVTDRIVGTTNIKHTHGLIGVITSNFVDRTEEYGAIAKMTLGLWYGRNWNRPQHSMQQDGLSDE